MIKSREYTYRSVLRLLAGLLVVVTLSACTKDEATDYCKNHYVFHFEHKDTLPVLNVTISDEGLVAASLVLKGDLADEFRTNPAIQQVLLDPANIYRIQSGNECSDTVVTQGTVDGFTSLTFESQCDANDQIKQMDVALFDNLPNLDEVVAIITTPATRKHFAISRQCDGAIYRLQKKQDPQ